MGCEFSLRHWSRGQQAIQSLCDGGGGGGGGERGEEKLKSFEWQWGMSKSVRVMWWGQRRRKGGPFLLDWRGLEKEKEGQNYISDRRDRDGAVSFFFFLDFISVRTETTGAQRSLCDSHFYSVVLWSGRFQCFPLYKLGLVMLTNCESPPNVQNKKRPFCTFCKQHRNKRAHR